LDMDWADIISADECPYVLGQGQRMRSGGSILVG